MAGIAFEIRKILRKKSLIGLSYALTYGISISAGPIIISIFSILFSGFVAREFTDEITVRQYQIIVTYIIALSLIISSPFQLILTRYIADRYFRKETEEILPNFLGALVISSFLGFLTGSALSLVAMKELPTTFKLVFTLLLSLNSGFWLINILLTAFKDYKFILFSFAIGFGTIVLITPFFSKLKIEGLLTSFFIGVAITFILLTGYLFKMYPTKKLFDTSFLRSGYKILIPVSFFYNIGVWIDKFIFWFSPDTGSTVLGPFKSSIVYDIPMFLAYLAITPGMGYFFLKLEGEFALYYSKYYGAIIENETLERIYELGHSMITAARSIIQETIRIQAIVIIVLLLFEKAIFSVFHISLVYIPLFNVLLLGTSLQLLVMAVLSLIYYFDLKTEALIVTTSVAILNAILTYLSIKLGPYFYGYGFFSALLISLLLGILLLRRVLYEIHYRTFMLNSYNS